MQKTTVEICCGTACYLLGAANLMSLAENLPADLADKVEFSAHTCLGACDSDEVGGAPYVRFNGTEIMAKATPGKVIDRLREILDIHPED